MNANELADGILAIEERIFLTKKEHQLFQNSATMLRQQADLIRNLQKSLGFKNSGYETINLTPQLELTDEEIADLIANKVTDSEMIKQALKKAQEK